MLPCCVQTDSDWMVSCLCLVCLHNQSAESSDLTRTSFCTSAGCLLSEKMPSDKKLYISSSWNQLFNSSVAVWYHNTQRARKHTRSQNRQRTRLDDGLHWKFGERMHDSSAAACHAFHTSSLLTMKTCRTLGGPEALKPHCSAPFESNLTQSFTFWNSICSTFLELKTFTVYATDFQSTQFHS